MPTKKASGKKGTGAKKATAKKGASKKTAAKKATAKKGASKKTAAKKTPAKKTAATKKTATKQPASKKAASKKAAMKKATATKAPDAKTPTPSPGVRRSGGLLGSSPTPSGKQLTSTPYDKKFLEAQRALLLQERNDYTHQAEVLLAEAESLTADREPGDVQFDEESGEGDTLAVERERDLALSAQARAAVEEIDAALSRIDDGVYGICRVSGLAIPKERLKAIPWATERVEYKVGGFSRR